MRERRKQLHFTLNELTEAVKIILGFLLLSKFQRSQTILHHVFSCKRSSTYEAVRIETSTIIPFQMAWDGKIKLN